MPSGRPNGPKSPKQPAIDARRDRRRWHAAHRTAAYLSAVETDVKVVFRPEPTVPTTVIMATEIPAAIRPYSIAVAPSSLRQNCLIFDIDSLLTRGRVCPCAYATGFYAPAVKSTFRQKLR